MKVLKICLPIQENITLIQITKQFMEQIQSFLKQNIQQILVCIKLTMKRFILNMQIISLDRMRIFMLPLVEEMIDILFLVMNNHTELLELMIQGIIVKLDHLTELVFYFQLYMSQVSMVGQIKMVKAFMQKKLQVLILAMKLT